MPAPVRHHADLSRRRPAQSGRARPRRHRQGAWPPRSSSTAHTARSSRARPASTAAAAARCTPSSRLSASIPNNAIVGGSGSIAPGAALFKRVNRKPGIVVANIGDASFGCGPVWEGITFSAMDQYRKLWDESLGGGLPIIFNCMNNFYGMGGQPSGETMGVRVHRPHRRRRQSRPDACRARQRLRSAARHRRLPPQEADSGGRRRPGPARYRHLSHQRPLALRCFQLPLQGRDRALAAGRLHPAFRAKLLDHGGISPKPALDSTRAASRTLSSRCSSSP